MVGALVMVFLGAGCGSQVRVQQDTALLRSVTVEMDEQGFRPAQVTLAKGGKVVFKNVGQTTDVWPASAVHPAHLEYPKFDPKRGIKPRESYEIDFPEVKTYRYHDHLNPTKFGKVVVE